MDRPITSASNLHRRASCPASMRLEAAAPVPPESADASEGTMLHAEIVTKGSAPYLTEEQAWAVGVAHAATEGLAIGCFGFGSLPDNFEREVELDCGPGLTGHADFVAKHGDSALVVDYKFGRDPVPAAESNWQLRAYAVGASRRYGSKHVFAAIIQPRLPADKRATLVEYGPEDLTMSGDAILAVLAACAQPCEPTPSAEACRYCRARGTCPALHAVEASLVASEPAHLTLANAAEMWAKAALVQRRLDAITDQIREMVMAEHAAGRTVPGLTVKDGAKVRQITNAQAAFDALSLPPETFIKACKVSVADLEKLHKEATGGKGKAHREAFEAALTSAGCLELKQNRPSITPTKENQ